MNNSNLWIYVLILLLRLISAILILFQPIIGWVLSVYLDAIDYSYAIKAKLTFVQYQIVDKTVDMLLRLAILGYVLINQKEYYLFFIFIILLRFIGDILFAITKKQIYLFLFPNFSDAMFPVYIIFYSFNMYLFYLFFVLAFVFKIIQEYRLHIVKYIDPYSKKLIEKHPEHNRYF